MYSKPINPNFFGKIEIKGEPNNENNPDNGIVYANYILSEKNEEASKEYDKFMKEYKKKHKYCPKCFSTSYNITLVGFVLNLDKKEEYKDLNNCTCTECGDRHTYHERVQDKN